jgi:glutamate-1-semialdehyde 2,1-aminomutase
VTQALAAETLPQQYQSIVRRFLAAPTEVTVSQDLFKNFVQIIQTASPETVTTETVLGLLSMGQAFLREQAKLVQSGTLANADFLVLRGRLRDGAQLLGERSPWLDEAARGALRSFVTEGETGEGARGGGHLAEARPADLERRRALAASRYARSQALFQRATARIPLGAQSHRKSYRELPRDASPLFLERGEGAWVWDVDGNRYLDLFNALMVVTLGHRDPDVDGAIRAQLERGLNLSLATPLELELAEELVELIPCAEMVRYGKNGSDATSAAVRLARAVTGRDRIAACGYHGYPDWYIGSTSLGKGVPGAVRALTHHFAFNQIETLEVLLKKYPNEFACVILEPMHEDRPVPGFLDACRDLIHAHGGLLIFDETITGFRFHLGGAQTLFGVTPDLATFSKSIANGMPLSAVTGPADILKRLDGEVYYSVTYGGECLSLAAGLATVRKMRREPVIETLWARGDRLTSGVLERIDHHGLADRITLRGAPCFMHLAYFDGPGASTSEVRALLQQELLFRGVLVTRSHNISYALTEEQVDFAVQAYDEALAEVAAGLAAGDLGSRLVNPDLTKGLVINVNP